MKAINFNARKGQASVEYSLLLGLLFLILAVVLVFAYTKFTQFENESSLIQGRMAVEKLCNSVNEFAYFDDGSVQYFTVYLPKSYVSGSINDPIVNFRIGYSDVNCIVDSPVKGTLPASSGKVALKLEKINGEVVIGE